MRTILTSLLLLTAAATFAEEPAAAQPTNSVSVTNTNTATGKADAATGATRKWKQKLPNP